MNFNNNAVTAVNWNGSPVSAIYYNGVLVWSAV